MSLTEREIDDFERMADAFWHSQLDDAVRRLSKLNVAELRTLMAHYAKGVPADYRDMPKRDLVQELADMIVEDDR